MSVVASLMAGAGRLIVFPVVGAFTAFKGLLIGLLWFPKVLLYLVPSMIFCPSTVRKAEAQEAGLSSFVLTASIFFWVLLGLSSLIGFETRSYVGAVYGEYVTTWLCQGSFWDFVRAIHAFTFLGLPLCVWALISNGASGLYELGRWRMTKKNSPTESGSASTPSNEESVLSELIDNVRSFNDEKAEKYHRRISEAVSNGRLSQKEAGSLRRMVESRRELRA